MGARPLVRIREGAGDAPLPDSLLRLVEVAFRIPDGPALRLDLGAHAREAAQLFARRVARTPGDLLSHVRRIYLHVARQDTDDAYGALLDLFAALGGKGRPLRDRMLRAAAGVLRAEQHAALAGRLEHGLAATDNMPPSTASMLGTPGGNGRSLIERAQANAADLADPLRQARDHLEYGQLDEACMVLEEALLTEPERHALHAEILEIYRRTRNKGRLSELLHRLAHAGLPLPTALVELALTFGIEVPA